MYCHMEIACMLWKKSSMEQVWLAFLWIYQPYCHLHVYNSIKIMVGTFVSTIILSLQLLVAVFLL